jgi:hypothetical protein
VERTARTKASNKVAVKRKKVSNKTAPKKKRTKKVTLDDGDGEVVTPNVFDQPPVASKKGKQTKEDGIIGVGTPKKKRVVGGGNKKQERLASNGRILVRPTKWDVILPARRGEGSSSYDEDDEEDEDDDDNDEIIDDAIVNTEDGHDEIEDDPAMHESIEESSTSSVESKERRICHTSSDEDSEVLNCSAQEGTANPPKEKASEEDSEVLNRSAQKGTANPPERNPNAAASSLVRFDGDILVRGMSKKESVRNRQKHVADRVIQYVKSDVFRRIKFINSDAMFQKAFQLVTKHENVPQHQRLQFQMLYENAFNHALNTKRSSCEQAGGKIMRKTLSEFKERGEEFFIIEEICKLRRAATERERKAFFWFFDTFLECVCGARYWRKAKATMLVSEAADERGKLVTKSDEAFALLLIDNYIDKWKDALTEEVEARTDKVTEGDQSNNNKKSKRLTGKYTAITSGHCKYGGWSRDGTARFNELYNLVQEDRASAKSEEMECELLALCRRSHVGAITDGNAEQEQGGGNASDGIEAAPVEAAWDLDD